MDLLFHVDESSNHYRWMPGSHGIFDEGDWQLHHLDRLVAESPSGGRNRKLVLLNDKEADEAHKKLEQEYSEEEVKIGDCFTLFAYKNYDQDDEEMYPGAIARVVDFGRTMAPNGGRYVIVQIISRNANPKRADLELDPDYVFYRADPATRTINFMEELKPRVRDLDLGSVLALEEIVDYMIHDPDSCQKSTAEAIEDEKLWEYLEPR